MHAMKSWVTGFIIGLLFFVIAPQFEHKTGYISQSYWIAVLVITPFAVGALVALSEKPVMGTATLVAVGILCSYMTRVQIDIQRDRTSHNLIPFELMFILVGTFLGGTIGGLLGALANKSVKPRTRS